MSGNHWESLPAGEGGGVYEHDGGGTFHELPVGEVQSMGDLSADFA